MGKNKLLLLESMIIVFITPIIILLSNTWFFKMNTMQIIKEI